MLGRPAAFDHMKPLTGWPMPGAGQLTPPIYLEDRPFLSPHLGYDISRPTSAASAHSAPLHAYVPQRISSAPIAGLSSVQLPGLSTLASLAASSAPAHAR